MKRVLGSHEGKIEPYFSFQEHYQTLITRELIQITLTLDLKI